MVKRTNRRRRRRYYKKRKRYNKPLVRTVNNPTGVPDVLRTKLVYSDQFTIEPGQFTYGAQIMAGNSVYDPDTSGIGHQPRGYDQWSVFYNKYRVYASGIKVHFFSDRSSSEGLTNVWIMPTSEEPSGLSYGIASINENPYGKSGALVPYVGKGTTFMKHYMSTMKIFGEKSISEDGYEGRTGNFATGADPENLWWWTIGGQSVNNDNLRMHATITMTYYVEFFDRKSLSES